MKNREIKTSGFTKEQEAEFDKMELEQAYFDNLIELESKLKNADKNLFSSVRDELIEGKTTPKKVLNNWAVRGEVGKSAYPVLSKYAQNIREKFMKKAVEAGREDTIPAYLDRFSKNLKKGKQ